MGAWFFVEHYVSWAERKGSDSRRLRYVGRPAAASTAVGQRSKHQAQLRAFLDDAFA
jgi:2-oxoglutarate dehydrogenase E1 component